MGQVWSKADFDGLTGSGNEGGRGSCLGVTAQNPGEDGVWGTADDNNAPMNIEPLEISIDASVDETDLENPADRVRNFFGYHPGGCIFSLADGSTFFLRETIDPAVYRELSTMNGGEVVEDFR